MKIRLASDPRALNDFIALPEARRRACGYFTLGKYFKLAMSQGCFPIYYWKDNRVTRYYVRVDDLDAFIDAHIGRARRALIDKMPDWLRARAAELDGVYVEKAFIMFAEEHGLDQCDRLLRGSFLLATRRVGVPVVYYKDIVEYCVLHDRYMRGAIPEHLRRLGASEKTILHVRSAASRGCGRGREERRDE